MRFNKWGGVIPETNLDKDRAEHAKLGTIRPDVACRACISCQYYGDPSSPVAYCSHPELLQMVSMNMACAYWKNSALWLPAK